MQAEDVHKVEWIGHYEQFGQKHPVEFQDISIHPEGGITGGGKDANGDFTISGHLDQSNNVVFAKKYATYTVDYNGVLSNGAITGKWSVQGASGDFEIKMKSHAFVGSFTGAKNNKTDMTLRLNFGKGLGVQGMGYDSHGNFTIKGACPPEFGKNLISFEKVYFNNKTKHFFAGVIQHHTDKDVIQGTWQNVGTDSGLFEVVLTK